MDLNEPPYRNLETRTKSIINGVPVLIRATHEGTDVEYPDPLAFGQKVAHLRTNLHSGSAEVSQLVNKYRMRDLFCHYPNESAKPSVYA